MDLSLDEAAVRCGMTVRQVRYLVQQGRLKARKDGSRWLVREEDLPASPQRTDAATRQHEALQAAAARAIGPEPERRRRYSVRDLRAFQAAMRGWSATRDALGADHAATRTLRGVLDQLAVGCHRYEVREKTAAYRQARDLASLATVELLLAERPPLVDLVEQELLGHLAALLARGDRRESRW